MLYEDKKGPIAAKTYGGTSSSSVQSKVEKTQKTKGILNVYIVYVDHTNDKMLNKLGGAYFRQKQSRTTTTGIIF